MPALRRLTAFLVSLLLSFPTPLHAEVTAVSQAEDILSFVKLHLKEIKDEPEAVRQAVIREVADLEISLGRFEDALAEDIQDPNYKEMILSRAAVKQCEQGDREGAETKIATLQNRLYRVDAHTGMGAALAAQGDPLHASSHFKEANDLFFYLANDEDKIERQKELVLAQFEAGYFEQAASTIDGIFDDRHKAKVLSRIMVRIRDKGRYEKIRFMVEATQDKFVRDELKEELVRLQAKAGLFDAASSQAAGLPAPARVRAFCEMAISRFRAGMKDEAGEFLGNAEGALREITNSREKARALGVFAPAQSEMGLSKKAAADFDAMKALLMRLPHADMEKAELLVRMAEGQRMNSQAEEAYGNFYEARGVLSELPDRSVRTALLSRIAKSMLLLKREEEAKEFFAQCFRQAREMDAREARVGLMVRIAADQAEGGLSADASDTLQRAAHEAAEAGDEEERDTLLQQIALAYVDEKDLKPATDLLGYIRRPLKKGDVLHAVLREEALRDEEGKAVEAAKNLNSKPLMLRGLLGAASGILERSLEIG